MIFNEQRSVFSCVFFASNPRRRSRYLYFHLPTKNGASDVSDFLLYFEMPKRTSVSLFSCAGFGDVGISYGNNVKLLAACELLSDRADVLQQIFPKATVFADDIWSVKDELVSDVNSKLNNNRLWLLIASPPCQGMSSNGAGRIAQQVSKGKRPELDPRNRLIVPTLDVANQLQPEYIIIENVANMKHTLIENEDGTLENIIDMIKRRLPNYRFETNVLDVADYGVPQHRKRLITVGKRGESNVTLHPPVSHGTEKNPHVTLLQATKHLSQLDAKYKLCDKKDALHNVPRWTDTQYFCMQHTPSGCTAFDNDKCVSCGSVTHDKMVARCESCLAWLPRPRKSVNAWECAKCGAHTNVLMTKCNNNHTRSCDCIEVESFNVIKAFRTSYRRMNATRPASTLTTNSGVISSDVKGHPNQNRVLSAREILIVSSIDTYPDCEDVVHKFKPAVTVLEKLNDRLLRHVTGESIPPLLTCKIVKHLIEMESL